MSSVRAPLGSGSPTLLSASLTLSFASMALIMPGGSILHKVLMYSYPDWRGAVSLCLITALSRVPCSPAGKLKHLKSAWPNLPHHRQGYSAQS